MKKRRINSEITEQDQIIATRLRRQQLLNEQLQSRLVRPKELTLKQIENGIKIIDFEKFYDELKNLYQAFRYKEMMLTYAKVSKYQLTFSKSHIGKSLDQVPLPFLNWCVSKDIKAAQHDIPFIENFLRCLIDMKTADLNFEFEIKDQTEAIDFAKEVKIHKPDVYKKLQIQCLQRMDEEYYEENQYLHQFCKFIAFHEIYELPLMVYSSLKTHQKSEVVHFVMNVGVPTQTSRTSISFGTPKHRYKYSQLNHKANLYAKYLLPFMTCDLPVNCFIEPRLGVTCFHSLLNVFEHKFFPFFLIIAEFATEFSKLDESASTSCVKLNEYVFKDDDSDEDGKSETADDESDDGE